MFKGVLTGWEKSTDRNQEKEIVVEQDIHIELRFNLATGKVGPNEIVYKLSLLQNSF